VDNNSLKLTSKPKPSINTQRYDPTQKNSIETFDPAHLFKSKIKRDQIEELKEPPKVDRVQKQSSYPRAGPTGTKGRVKEVGNKKEQDETGVGQKSEAKTLPNIFSP
jgi:hypothetical protein